MTQRVGDRLNSAREWHAHLPVHVIGSGKFSPHRSKDRHVNKQVNAPNPTPPPLPIVRRAADSILWLVQELDSYLVHRRSKSNMFWDRRLGASINPSAGGREPGRRPCRRGRRGSCRYRVGVSHTTSDLKIVPSAIPGAIVSVVE